MSEKKLYVLKNLTKKNVYCTEFWVNPETDESFKIEEMFRWGETTLSLTDEEAAEIRSDLENGFPVSTYEYEIEDQHLDDGCALDFYAEDELLVEKVEEIFDNYTYSGLEEEGFFCDDAEVMYHGECELEEVNE